jgi:hypothetical protein
MASLVVERIINNTNQLVLFDLEGREGKIRGLKLMKIFPN